MKRLALMTLLAVAFTASPAQAAAAGNGTTATTVWRCGAEGRVYTDTPCAAGRAVDVADPRSAEQVAAAREVLAADIRRAQAMRQERMRAEAAARQAQAGGAAAAPLRPTALRQPQPAAKERQAPPKKKPRPAADGTWRATAPASPRAPG